jgi:hypothetical protein
MNFILKIVWAFSWMFFGLIIAYSNGISEPTMMALFSIGSLIFGDTLKYITKLITTRAIT